MPALAQQILQRKGPDLSQAVEEAGGGKAGGAGADEGSGSFLGRQVASRAQVYQQLAQAAALLRNWSRTARSLTSSTGPSSWGPSRSPT